MAHLYKPVTVKPIPRTAVVKTIDGIPCACWTNRKARKVTAPLTDDGSKCRVESPTWWIEYTAASGRPDRKKGFRDRGATMRLAVELETAAEDIRGGRAAPRHEAAAHLADHLPTFRASLERKGNSIGHIDDTIDRVQKVITEMGLTTPGIVNRERIELWLDTEQRREDWSARTRNRYAGALNQFGRYLVRERKATSNPFDGLTRQNIETDRRVTRRVLEPDDLARLILAARDSATTFHGLNGTDRAMLYTLAAYTGRRLSALKKMTATDVTFENGLPVAISTGARLQKSKKTHTVPVHPDLAADLAAWLASKPRKGPLFTGWKVWADRGAELIQHDLAAARTAWIEEAGHNARERAAREASDRLKYHDDAGEVFDFHALRGQFITSLAMNNVPLTAAQELADHSDPKLTANVYTKWKNRLADEVKKLPAPPVRLGSELGSGLGLHRTRKGNRDRLPRAQKTKKRSKSL